MIKIGEILDTGGVSYLGVNGHGPKSSDDRGYILVRQKRGGSVTWECTAMDPSRPDDSMP